MTTMTTTDPSRENNRLYLLRLWRAEPHAECWRAVLQDPRTGQRIGFATLEQLFAFLMEQAERDSKEVNVR
jgi:hypothetical protein